MPLPRDDDSAAQAANERAARALSQEEPENEAGAEVVEVPEEGDDEEEEQQGASPQVVADRKERRRNRYREQADARVVAERENAELKARLSALESQRFQQPAREEPVKEDPIEKSLKETQEAASKLQSEYAALAKSATEKGMIIPDEVVANYRQRYVDLTTRQQELIAEKVARKNAPTSNVDPEMAAGVAALRMRYSDIASHPQVQRIAQWASATWQALQLRLGRTGTQEEMDQVMEDARRVFGLKKSPPPSATAKARFSGQSAGATGAPRTNGAPGAGQFVMNKHHKAMARAAFPGLAEKQAFQKYAQLQLRAGKN